MRLMSAAAACGTGEVKWVFLGPPGVGKGTYASRMANLLGVAHIATGDLIREEIKAATVTGVEMEDIVSAGKLVPDALIFQLLQNRLAAGRIAGERGFILDGFPRTAVQARTLLETTGIQMTLNLALREEVLVEKCLGRRSCTHCGKGYNVADIHLAAKAGRPEIRMPPLQPPASCLPHLETRADDTEVVVRRRLQVYNEQAAPVEEVFREAGLLVDFEITGGIPETLPILKRLLEPYMQHAAGGQKQQTEMQHAAVGQTLQTGPQQPPSSYQQQPKARYAQA